MRPLVSGVLAGMMMASLSLSAAEKEQLPEIKPGAPVGSCCVTALGQEGSSQQIVLGGEKVWSCQVDSHAFQIAWDKGNLPYSVLEDRLEGPVGTWSTFANADRPGGAGDYELLKNRVDSKQVCANPIAIECQRVSDGVDWRKSQSVYHCELPKGGYCVNKEQAAGKSCEDFKVRYLCANLKLRRFTAGSSPVPGPVR